MNIKNQGLNINATIKFLFAVMIAIPAGMIAGGVNSFLNDHEVLYYWHAVGAGLILAFIVCCVALSRGFLDTRRYQSAFLAFGNIMMGIIGYPILLQIFLEPSEIDRIPASVLQFGLPIAALFTLAVSGTGFINWQKPASSIGKM